MSINQFFAQGNDLHTKILSQAFSYTTAITVQKHAYKKHPLIIDIQDLNNGKIPMKQSQVFPFEFETLVARLLSKLIIAYGSNGNEYF